MNNSVQYYDNYPVPIVVLRNVLNIVTYGIGAVILSGLGAWAAISYLLYSVVMVIWVARFRCAYCYYYGKTCSLGYGRIAALLFSKGDNADFSKYVKYITPLFLVWVLPVLGGVVLLIRHFTAPTAVLVLLFVVVSFGISSGVQSKAGCAYCRQKENCPAYELMHSRMQGPS